MGLENLKSVFQEQLNNSIEEFSSNTITDVNGTKFFNTPPQPPINIATNPTDFSTAVGNNELPFIPLNQQGERFFDGLNWSRLYNPNHSFKDGAGHKGLTPISYPNVNRDKLNIRNPDDGRFGFGGSARTSAISAVGKLIGSLGLGGNVSQFLQDTGKEPYIVSTIPESSSDLFSGRTTNSNFLGRGLPVERGITDTIRIAKYLTSPSGLLFIGKQNLLGLQQIPFTQDLNRTQLFNAGARDFGAKFNLSYKAFYNPLSTLISTFGRAGGGPAGKVNKTEPGLAGLVGSIAGLEAFGDVFDSVYPKFQTENYPFGSQMAQILLNGRTIDGQFAPKTIFESDLPTTDDSPKKDSDFGDGRLFTSDKQPYSPDFSINETFRPANIDSEPNEPKVSGDKLTLAGMIKGNTLDSISGQTTGLNDEDNKLTFDIELEKEGMPFYFKDLRDNTYLFFRAYIEGLTESVSPSYSSTQYVGRSEPVYVYGMAEREVNFTLRLVAQTKSELSAIYKKMNRLTSMCYPEYFTDETVNYGNRMKPPLTKLRIGEYFGKLNNELTGYIKSLSYNIDQSAVYETEPGKRVPEQIIATIGYQIIHGTTPQLKSDVDSDFEFYGYVGDNNV